MKLCLASVKHCWNIAFASRSIGTSSQTDSYYMYMYMEVTVFKYLALRRNITILRSTSSDLSKCALIVQPRKKHRNQLQISIEFSTQVLHNHGTLSEKQIAAVVHCGA